jgi:thiamine biosynthesis lipoprotein
MRLDLSGIAKGFAVDCAVQVLENAGVPSGLVNAGGDLRAFGPDSFAVQIRDPKDPNQSMMELLLKEEALCNSGTYFNRIEHCGKVLHHLIDPFRETSCKSFSAAGVLAPSCLLADALSKILMVKGEGARGLLKVLNSHGYVVGSKDNEISWFGVPRKERQS